MPADPKPPIDVVLDPKAATIAITGYQPTIDLSDMSPTGVEALIRWRHPERGVLQPEDFIPLLEESGLIT